MLWRERCGSVFVTCSFETGDDLLLPAVDEVGLVHATDALGRVREEAREALLAAASEARVDGSGPDVDLGERVAVLVWRR